MIGGREAEQLLLLLLFFYPTFLLCPVLDPDAQSLAQDCFQAISTNGDFCLPARGMPSCGLTRVALAPPLSPLPTLELASASLHRLSVMIWASVCRARLPGSLESSRWL